MTPSMRLERNVDPVAAPTPTNARSARRGVSACLPCARQRAVPASARIAAAMSPLNVASARLCAGASAAAHFISASPGQGQ